MTEKPTVNPETFCSGIAVKYRIALSIIALLSCIAYFSLSSTIVQEASSASAINLSGRQRMLSQQIVLLSRELVAAKGSDSFQAAQAKLEEAIQAMEQEHNGLIHNQEATATPAIAEIYFSPPYEADRRTHAFIERAHALAASDELSLTPRDPNLLYLSNTAPELLQLLDKAVSRYEERSHKRVKRILLLERGILACTLLVLLLVAHFIFHPMVRQLKERARKLLQNEKQLHEILSSMGEGLIVTNSSLKITACNPAAARLLGWDEKQITNARLVDIVGDLIPDSGRSFAAIVQDRQPELHGEHLFTRRDGSSLPIAYAITHLRGDHEISHIITFKDISERKRHEDQIKHLAYHDTLTNLPNRRLFNDRLSLELAHAKRNKGIIAVMFLDLDEFKIINDTLGHDIGDEVLRVAAQRIQATLRESDTVARMGGDEFILLASRLESEEDATRVAEKIIHQLTQPIEAGGSCLTVSTSIGISIYPQDADNDIALIAKADCAMYAVKRQGRNGFALCSEVRAQNNCPQTCKYH